MYRVINKEGHKVMGYKTPKKCDFDAIKRFIAFKNIKHIVIFLICPIIYNIISNVKYIKNVLNCLNLSYFSDILGFLGKNSDFWPFEVAESNISANK